MYTVKLLYEIKSNVRVLIVYEVVAHSSRFDSRSACDLLDCFLSELIDVEGRSRQAFSRDSTKSRLAVSFSDLEARAGFKNTAELCRNMSEDDFSETKRCRSGGKRKWW